MHLTKWFEHIRAQPTQEHNWIYLGDKFCQYGDFEYAVQCYENVTKIDSKNPNFSEILSNALSKMVQLRSQKKFSVSKLRTNDFCKDNPLYYSFVDQEQSTSLGVSGEEFQQGISPHLTYDEEQSINSSLNSNSSRNEMEITNPFADAMNDSQNMNACACRLKNCTIC